MADVRNTDWVDEIVPPFQGFPFMWKIGVRPLDITKWLVVDGDLAADRIEKAELLEQRHDEMVVARPGAELAAAELAELVVADLRFRGLAVPDVNDSLHPVEQAARLVQEDLVVLERDESEWRLSAACVCFPTHWDLASKLGQSMQEIHRPVPRYEADLGAKTDTFFDRLRVERPVWRPNWTISTDHGNRLEPGAVAETGVALAPAEVGQSLCLRVEYQTLRRLPQTGAIVFTIRLLRRRLQWVLDHEEGLGLMAALEAMPNDVADYKSGSVRYREEILSWLSANGVS